jgi:hypothetical protein
MNSSNSEYFICETCSFTKSNNLIKIVSPPKSEKTSVTFNPILHALTLKSNTAKYYFGEKSNFLHTFLKFCRESKKI